MRTGLNIIWFIFGGLISGIAWALVGVLLTISIVGIPWARAAFVVSGFIFHPFGREVIARDELTGRNDIGTSGAGFIGNIMWFLIAGWWLALGHAMSAFLNAISIIGIPFAVQHLKLAGIAVAPIGKTVVMKEVATLARQANAQAALHRYRKP